VHWLSLGELSRLIETFKQEGVTRAIMAGQVKHKQIFSSIKPDWKLAKLLMSLTTRNTDSLIGAVAKVLADEGITLLNSASLLEPLLARPGVLTRRRPDDKELENVDYGRRVARHLDLRRQGGVPGLQERDRDLHRAPRGGLARHSHPARRQSREWCARVHG